MKLLILTSRFPYPLEKGDKLRIYHHIKELSKEHEITLISLSEKEVDKKDIDHLDQWVQKQYLFKIPKWKRFISVFGAFFKSQSFRNAYFYSHSVKQKIDAIVQTEKPDWIHCHLIRMSEYVKDVKGPKSLDYMDSFSMGAKKRMENSKGLESWFFKKEYLSTQKYESAIFKHFDHHLIISAQDQDSLPFAERRDVQITSNGIDTEFFKARNVKGNHTLGFIGNLGYYPNVRAVEYISQRILPKLSSETNLLIAGARPDAKIRMLQSNRITVKGWVEDIRDAYQDCRIFIAPLFDGIGQQNKILEAMACGIPVITTSTVNKAIGAIDRKQIMIADTPQEFVNAINELEASAALYQSIRQEGLSLVKENYTWEKQTEVLTKLIESRT